MKSANNFFRDIATGLLLTTGIFGFISGEFVLSTLLFGAASLFSSLDFNRSIQL